MSRRDAIGILQILSLRKSRWQRKSRKVYMVTPFDYVKLIRKTYRISIYSRVCIKLRSLFWKLFVQHVNSQAMPSDLSINHLRHTTYIYLDQSWNISRKLNWPLVQSFAPLNLELRTLNFDVKKYPPKNYIFFISNSILKLLP